MSNLVEGGDRRGSSDGEQDWERHSVGAAGCPRTKRRLSDSKGDRLVECNAELPLLRGTAYARAIWAWAAGMLSRQAAAWAMSDLRIADEPSI